MIAENSILRRLPHSVSLEDRLLLEAIGFCLTVSSYSYENLISLLPEDADEIAGRIRHYERMAIINECWSIVGQGYNLSRLLNAFQKLCKAADLSTSIKKYENILSGMRNIMDHIPGQAKNLASAKGGAFSYMGNFVFAVRHKGFSEKGLPSVGYAFVEVLAGVQSKQLTSSERRLNYNAAVVIGNCWFEAFGHVLDITEYMADLAKFSQEFEDKLLSMIIDSAVMAAKQNSESLSDLLKHGDDICSLTTRMYTSPDDTAITVSAVISNLSVEPHVSKAYGRAVQSLETTQ